MLMIHASLHLSVSEGPSLTSTPKTVTTDLISASARTRIIMTSLSFRLGQIFFLLFCLTFNILAFFFLSRNHF